MASPAGVSSGSAPEPVVPEPPPTEPTALESAVPEQAGPALGEDAAAIAVPGPSEPAPGENAAAIVVPGPSEPALGENLAVSADPELESPANERVRERRGGSWLVTAVVVIVLVAVAAAAGALYVTTHGFRHKTIVTYRPAAVYGLRAGDCLNPSQNGLSVTILSCATPHEAEVFATFSLTGSAWPGRRADLAHDRTDACLPGLLVGIDILLGQARVQQLRVQVARDPVGAAAARLLLDGRAAGPIRFGQAERGEHFGLVRRRTGQDRDRQPVL